MQKETKIQGILMCLFYLGNLCLDLLTNQLPQAMRTNPQEQAAPGGVPGGLLELRSKGRAHPVIPILVTSFSSSTCNQFFISQRYEENWMHKVHDDRIYKCCVTEVYKQLRSSPKTSL